MTWIMMMGIFRMEERAMKQMSKKNKGAGLMARLSGGLSVGLLKIVLAVAVVAGCFGCAKDKGEKEPETFTRKVKVTVTKGDKGNVGGAGTKTTVVEGADKATFYWTDGDQDNFNIYEKEGAR